MNCGDFAWKVVPNPELVCSPPPNDPKPPCWVTLPNSAPPDLCIRPSNEGVLAFAKLAKPPLSPDPVPKSRPCEFPGEAAVEAPNPPKVGAPPNAVGLLLAKLPKTGVPPKAPVFPNAENKIIGMELRY